MRSLLFFFFLSLREITDQSKCLSPGHQSDDPWGTVPKCFVLACFWDQDSQHDVIWRRISFTPGRFLGFCSAKTKYFELNFIRYLLNDKILGNSRWIIRKGWKTNQYGENLLFVNGNFAVCASCQPNVACYGTEEEQHKLIIVPPSLVQVLCTSGHWQITTSCCSFGNNLQIIW